MVVFSNEVEKHFSYLLKSAVSLRTNKSHKESVMLFLNK